MDVGAAGVLYSPMQGEVEQESLDVDLRTGIGGGGVDVGAAGVLYSSMQGEVERDTIVYKNSAECAICFKHMQRERQVALVPCGHVCMCKDCAELQKTCPLCRGAVQMFIKLYYS